MKVLAFSILFLNLFLSVVECFQYGINQNQRKLPSSSSVVACKSQFRAGRETSVMGKARFCMSELNAQPPDVTVLPGMKQVLFIEVGFGADQHGQVLRGIDP